MIDLAPLMPLRRATQRVLRRLGERIDRRTMRPAELESVFATLGIRVGATVFIHSSMDALHRRVPELSPIALIGMLQRLLTPAGTLLMPTFPFKGKQADYVARTQRFDVRRTQSQVGLLTEVFRRMPGVERSLHPTHPVAAWGQHASVLLEAHHRGTAFGTNSPLCRLREFDGLVIGLGTGLVDSFTIMHVVEEIHPKAYDRFFSPIPHFMTIVNDGVELPYELRVLRPDVRRRYRRVARTLFRERIVRRMRRRGLRCEVTDAGRFIERCLRLADADRYL